MLRKDLVILLLLFFLIVVWVKILGKIKKDDEIFIIEILEEVLGDVFIFVLIEMFIIDVEFFLEDLINLVVMKDLLF